MRIRNVTPAIACSVVVLSGCSDLTSGGDGPRVCTAEARPGLVVMVRDSATGTPVVDALVIARGPAAADTARVGFVQPEGALYYLLYERPGIFTIRVEHAGHQPWERAAVSVIRGECHVSTVALTAPLTR